MSSIAGFGERVLSGPVTTSTRGFRRRTLLCATTIATSPVDSSINEPTGKTPIDETNCCTSGSWKESPAQPLMLRKASYEEGAAAYGRWVVGAAKGSTMPA